MMSALPLASASLIKLSIFFQNNIVDGDSCSNVFYFHIVPKRHLVVEGMFDVDGKGVFHAKKRFS